MSHAQELINLIRKRHDLKTKESVQKLESDKNNSFTTDILYTNYGGYSKAFRMAIDDIIEKYSSRFTKDNYLYRISRTQKTAYSPPSEILNPKLRKITTGDIIMDRALWSSAIRAETTIFRYSSKGESITHKTPKLDTEEEVLFIIENNEHLKAIDISGYKFSKEQEGRTSGELLIKSHSKFKVIGIQKSDPRLDRRIIILEPVSDDSLKPSDAIKDPYSGNPYDPTTLPAISLAASTPKTDPTSEATASTSSVETEIGAVGGATGGATGTSFPEKLNPWDLP